MYPSTKVLSKQLLPVYDKPMIFYPLNTLMQAKINNILIIASPDQINLYENLLGNGNELGIKINYTIQMNPNGLAEAFLLGEEFIAQDKVALILGDNIFYMGKALAPRLSNAGKITKAQQFFGYMVANPNRFGVIEFDGNNKAISIDEKPKLPKSNYAVTGLYLYDNEVVSYTKTLKPSKRNELEITDLNNIYINNNKMNVTLLDRHFTWLDTGTNESMLEASQFVHTIEKQQGRKIACIEETAFKNNWITIQDLKSILKKNAHGSYKTYLNKIIKDYENN